MGQTTPAELLAAARGRAAAVNPHLNAIVRDVDPPMPQGPEPDGGRPFAGVPFLLKDLHQDLAGVPTSGGSRALQDLPAVETAAVVERWVQSGLVIFGRTNSPEFGAKGITEPHAHGPTRNPWNVDHTPGGSSGGSAAAVAAGVVPCAAASDGGGSIRIPASACGLFGLKASRGLIPHGPAHGEPLGGTATDGVLSRSVRDTARMLDVLAGPTDVSPYMPGGIPPGGVRCRGGPRPGSSPHRSHLRQRHQSGAARRSTGCVRPGRRAAGRARPRGCGGEDAGRRRRAGPGLPHHLVRQLRRLGSRGTRGVRCHRGRVRA